MKSRTVAEGQNLTASQHDDIRDDARGGSFLLPHQQLGALALGTTPTNGQVVDVIVNSTTIPFTAVTGTPTNPGDVKAPGTAAGFVANLLAGLRRPDLSSSTFVALSSANQALIQYLGWANPGSGTTIVPFSLNKNINGNTDILTSFNITTTVTSGTWTAQTLKVYIEDGTYYIGNTRVLYPGGSTPSFTAPSSHPRIDIVTADSSGTIAITQGTESVTPSAPTYPANKLVICEVYNVVGETAICDFEDQQSGQGYIYNDVRPLMNGGGYISSASQIASGIVIFDPGSDAQGDLLYFNGAGAWARLPAGTANQFLKTNGASANPSWSNPPTSLTIALGSRSGTDYTTTSTSLVSVDTGSDLALTNLTVGQKIYLRSILQAVSNGFTGTVSLIETVNSVTIATFTCTTNTEGIFGFEGLYISPSTSLNFRWQFSISNASNHITVRNPNVAIIGNGITTTVLTTLAAETPLMQVAIY